MKGMYMAIKPLELQIAMLKKNFLTQGDLAEAAGLSRVTVSMAINHGKCSIKTLVKIADALGIDPEEILKKDDE